MAWTRRALALGAIALALAACGGDDSAKTSAATSTSGAYDYATTSSTVASGGKTTVAVTGGHLVDADGMTLYLFEKDHGTTSACTGSCAGAWPALVASDAKPTGGAGVDASLLSTATGQVANQVTYNGHLLYRFSGDKAPGDTNGKSIPSWYLVDAKGAAIEG